MNLLNMNSDPKINKKKKHNKAVYPELKLLFEGEASSGSLSIGKKDFQNLNSIIEQGPSLHLYKGDFEAYFRNGNKIAEIPVEVSNDPSFEYIIADKIIDTWLNLETMKPELMSPAERTEFQNVFVAWASDRKFKIPSSWSIHPDPHDEVS